MLITTNGRKKNKWKKKVFAFMKNSVIYGKYNIQKISIFNVKLVIFPKSLFSKSNNASCIW